MHVLWTPSWYPDASAPLNGSFFVEQQRALQAAGMQVGTLCVSPQPFTHFRGARLRFDPTFSAYHMDMITAPRGAVPGELVALGAGLRRFAQQYERRWGIPDVIHAHSVFPGIFAAMGLAKIWDVPFGLTEHRPSTLHSHHNFRGRSIAQAVHRAAFVATVSAPFAELLTEKYGREFAVIDLPVPGNFFSAPAKDNPWPSARFLHVSHVDENKRVGATLEAFSQVVRCYPNAHLDIVGGVQGAVAKLSELSAALGVADNVSLHGSVPRDQIGKFFAGADYFVLFSAVEAGGTVLAEAQSMGLATIASATFAGKHMVDQQFGKVVPVDDVDALAEAMCALVVAKKLGKASSKTEIIAQNRPRFSMETFARRQCEIYRDATGAN
ncbi:MAG: glycosyltransferase [Actinomycetaceae bacterium]|nr:glycosyltransferase [Actinomycetaceae bacterium]